MRRTLRSVMVVAMLLGIAAIATSAIAATDVSIQLTDNGQAVPGARVEILSSTGITEVITNAQGLADFSMSGKYFRVRVDGVLLTGIHQSGQGLVTIEINN